LLRRSGGFVALIHKKSFEERAMPLNASAAKAIFLSALEKSELAERAAYVREACGNDDGLRQRVEILLRAHDDPRSFMDSPVAGSASVNVLTFDEPINERPGTIIGPYKLLEQIGEGGFGIVFMAEQQHPIRRKVALKVIKPGMDTRQVIARFEAERQALALMDHPNIAKVLDAGTVGGTRNQGRGASEDGSDSLIPHPSSLAPSAGRPYFVMELVKGVTITDFCEDKLLSIRDRLELFLRVCQAVQHAHQKGIIHRDIKPTNVLVTLHDGTPVPKIIDFGIAKALGQQLTDKTLFTQFAQLIGSPLYMSPEQAELSGLDVDTRSDIYSLGVMLYELLTGTTPLDKERLKTASYDEIRRIIREEEPPQPSTRLRKDDGARVKDETKRTRRTRGGRSGPFSSFTLHPSSIQELDWIVMKALEKDRNRRYESVSALAADVQRYLSNEAVLACPPSTIYRFRKFARRHRAALATAGLVLFLVVALGAGGGWMVRDRVAREAATDQAAEKALHEAIELQEKGKWPQALDAAKLAEGILAAGGSDPLRQRARERRNDIEMVLRLEDIRLPDSDRAVFNLTPQGKDEAAYARAFKEFGIDLEALDPGDAAERIRMHSIWLELAVALDNWADRCRSSRGKDAPLGKKLLAIAKAVDLDTWRNQLRDALARNDELTLNRLATNVNGRELPIPSLSLLVYKAWMDPKLQRSLLFQAHREHPEDYWINFQLGWIFGHVSEPYHDSDQAIRFYTAAVAVRPRFAPSRNYLADELRGRGRFDEAIAEWEKAIELDPDYLDARNNLAWFLATCPKVEFRDTARSLEHAAKAVELVPRNAMIRNTLGVAQYRASHWKAAIESLEKAEELAPGKYFAFNVFFLAMAHWQLGEKQKAREEYEQAVQWLKKNHPKDPELPRFQAEAEELMKKESGARK
jgi:serine/threonine protein kinase